MMLRSLMTSAATLHPQRLVTARSPLRSMMHAAAGPPRFPPRMTTLPNGVRVVSRDSAFPMAHVAVVARAGSRHDPAAVLGLSAMHAGGLAPQRPALPPPAPGSAGARAAARGIQMGGYVTPESLVFAADCLRDDAGLALAALADAALSAPANLTALDADVLASAVRLHAERAREACKAHALRVAADELAARAFGPNRAASPLTEGAALADPLALATPARVLRWRALAASPARTVVSAVGVDHDRLVEAAAALFDGHGDKTNNAAAADPVAAAVSLVDGVNCAPRSFAHPRPRYTGALTTVECVPAKPGAPLPAAATRAPLRSNEFADAPGRLLVDDHARTATAAVAIGVRAPPGDDEAGTAATAVLRTMLGGGARLSPGGAGKGFLSRLYQRVLFRSGAPVAEARAVHACTDTAGLLLAFAVVRPEDVPTVARALAMVLATTAHAPPSRQEAARARAQTLTLLHSEVEPRAGQCLSLAEHVLRTGAAPRHDSAWSAVAGVTGADIAAAAARAFSAPITVATGGAYPGAVDAAELDAIVRGRYM